MYLIIWLLGITDLESLQVINQSREKELLLYRILTIWY